MLPAEYLEKALDAEERARSITDPELRGRWLGVAFGYRELARFRQQTKDGAASTAASIVPRD